MVNKVFLGKGLISYNIIVIFGIMSKSVTLHWGTRQGSLLSPSLFAVFVEPLYNQI